LNRVAKRYAKALFELAADEKILEKIETDVNLIDQVVKENPDLSNMLGNPLINNQDKFNILKEIFTEKIKDLSLNFLDLLARKKRLAILADAIEAFNSMMLKYRNTVEAELVSAVELSVEQAGKIQEGIESITGKKLRLEKRLDPDIIGGFIVKFEDVVIDNSIRYQLAKLHEKLVAQ
jgi:F-type H+-transporting ATPase subunit delta